MNAVTNYFFILIFSILVLAYYPLSIIFDLSKEGILTHWLNMVWYLLVIVFFFFVFIILFKSFGVVFGLRRITQEESIDERLLRSGIKSDYRNRCYNDCKQNPQHITFYLEHINEQIKKCDNKKYRKDYNDLIFEILYDYINILRDEKRIIGNHSLDILRQLISIQSFELERESYKRILVFGDRLFKLFPEKQSEQIKELERMEKDINDLEKKKAFLYKQNSKVKYINWEKIRNIRDIFKRVHGLLKIICKVIKRCMYTCRCLIMDCIISNKRTRMEELLPEINSIRIEKMEDEYSEIIVELYNNLSFDDKKSCIHYLCGFQQGAELANAHGKAVDEIINNEIEAIVCNNGDQNKFSDIFGRYVGSTTLSPYCLSVLAYPLQYDSFETTAKKDVSKVYALLSAENCAFIFSYAILYNSVYLFRGNWKYINIELLKTLWRRIDGLSKHKEGVLKLFGEVHCKW